MSDMTITKREILVSIAIVCIMLLLGFVIAGSISTSLMEKHQEYNTALQVNEDKDLFEYGMRTSVGNAFVYGELRAVDPVGYEGVDGDYSYIKKVKEKYTKHTRVVTKTRTVNGKTQTYTDTETYWTWDAVDHWEKRSTKITFLDVEFNYGEINFPSDSHITTIKESSKIRYVYYGSPAQCKGTIYTQLSNNTINNATMYHNSTIEETHDSLTSSWQLILFWIVWILLTGGVVVGFYYIDNWWLED